MPPGEYFLLIDGETYGPYSPKEVRELWDRQQVPLDTFYVRKGMKEVRPLDEIINLVIGLREPEPATPPPPPPPRNRINPKMVMVVLLLIGGLYALLSGVNGIFFPAEKEMKVVRAGVQVTPVSIKITNNDVFDWNDMLIRLNDFDPGVHQYKLAHLTAGRSVTLSLVTFTDGAGRHFEPWKETVLAVWIGGEGYDFLRVVPGRP